MNVANEAMLAAFARHTPPEKRLIIFGIGTAAAPFLLMQPGMGAGIAAVGPGTAPGLVERADATVDGPAGALACLRYLDGALRRVQENGSPA